MHILDIVQNSVKAGAANIRVEINEDEDGFLTMAVIDDGKGMSPEQVARVRDPFYTTRTTRKVGMGIPFLDMTTAQTGGDLTITSEVGRGTAIKARFLKDHLDTPPLGDVAETIKTALAGAPDRHFVIRYMRRDREFVLDTDEIKAVLGQDVDYTQPDIYSWLDAYLRQEIEKVREAGN